MSTFEQKDNSGALFDNNRKERDSHPDLTGSCRVDGTDYWISGWYNKSARGQDYISLSLSPKDEPGAARSPINKTTGSLADRSARSPINRTARPPVGKPIKQPVDYSKDKSITPEKQVEDYDDDVPF